MNELFRYGCLQRKKETSIESGSNTANLLGMARTALLAGNNEEAYAYCNRVLEADPTSFEAWLGKAKAAGWQSTMINIRVSEMLIASQHAIATAPEGGRAAVVTQAVHELNAVIVALYSIARNHLMEYVSLPNIWQDYVSQISQLIDGLDGTRQLAPYDRTTLDNIVHLCKDNIEGVSYRDEYDNNASKAWTLAPQYEQLLKAKMEDAVQLIRGLDPSYAPPAIEKKQAESCFVVTATMGDFDHPTVTLMRAFRDRWLTQRRWGRTATTYYYRYGPDAAKYIGGSAIRRKLSYILIVCPAAWIAARLLR